MDTVRDSKAVRAWLYRIMRNEHARHCRQGRRETGLPDQSQLPAHGCHDTSAEAFAVRQAIQRLALNYRDPLLLQVLGGFSAREIADILGASQNAILTCLSRGRRKLRESLEREDTDWHSRRSN